MGEIQKAFAKLIIDYVKNNGIDGRLVAVVALITVGLWAFGIFSHWLWSRAKLIAEKNKIISETEKTMAECAKTRFEVLEKINEYSSELISHNDTLNLHMRQIYDCIITSDFKALDACREDAIRCFTVDLLPSFDRYISANNIYLRGKEHFFFIKNELFSYLRGYCNFLDMINDVNLLKELSGKSKLLLGHSTLVRAFNYIQSHANIFCIKIKKEINIVKNRLKEHQEP